MTDAPPAVGFDLPRRLAAEALGTGFLVATVVGSGIMADRLTDNRALELLGNTLPTGAILVALIAILAPISGAHFNPVVTLAMRLHGAVSSRDGMLYVAAQIGGGIVGTLVAHRMFDLPLLQVSTTDRSGIGQWFSESVATFGLLAVIVGGQRFRPQAIPFLVGSFIAAAYWFTASTSFANPAVAIARSLTDTFAGIRPAAVPAFIVAEVAGALAAAWFFGWLLRPTAAGTRVSRY